MNKAILVVGIGAALLAGCSSSALQQSTEQYQGRAETRKLEAASAAGYDGTAVRRSVDSALDKNDSHNQDLDKTLKPDRDGEQKQ